jgi:hypothetical protein
MLALSGLGSPLAVAHLAFAVGIVPLIFAAMIHFVPVLTRTGEPVTWVRRLPALAQVAGLLVVLALQGILPRWLVSLAAAVDLVVAGILLNWMVRRARGALGSPHPGWRWYAGALACLMMALLGVLSISIWPAYWSELRLFHLHLNTLGLVGLAAFGTLPVLLPTALGKPDPLAASWLRRCLWLVLAGVLMIAGGPPIFWAFALPGVLLILVATLGLLGQWIGLFGIKVLLRDGVAFSLLVAVLGFLLNIIAGVVHGAGLSTPRTGLLSWAVAFLLPLVSGALSQLLPVWRWPGPVIPERRLMREILARHGQWRSSLWLAAGLALLTDFEHIAVAFLLTGLLMFLFRLLQALRVSRPTR